MKLTREGKRFILAIVLLTFAAYNTGNNLIYLILALMLSILVMAAIVLLVNMRRLALRVSLRGPVFAGEVSDVDISLSNRKRLLPSYSMKIVMPVGMKGECRVPMVDAASITHSECRVSFDRRGVYKWGDFCAESSFPFIFLRRTIRLPVDGSVTVYPRLVDVTDLWSYAGAGRSYQTIRPGKSDELLTLREFRSGDDVKLINWKASAKSRGLIVKELAEEQPAAFNIILDDLRPFDAQVFERAVSYAASLAVKLIDEGFYIGLVTSAKVLPYGSGPEQLYRIMDVLSVIKEVEAPLRSFKDDFVGTNVLVLKSQSSPLMGVEADMVIYAAEL